MTFGRIIYNSIYAVNPALAMKNLDITGSYLSTSWKQGNTQQLKIKFYLNDDNISVCRFDFEVAGFWPRLHETLKEKNSNTQAFHDQVAKCEKNVLTHEFGASSKTALENTIVETNDLINKAKNISKPEAKKNWFSELSENLKKKKEDVTDALRNLFTRSKKEEHELEDKKAAAKEQIKALRQAPLATEEDVEDVKVPEPVKIKKQKNELGEIINLEDLFKEEDEALVHDHKVTPQELKELVHEEKKIEVELPAIIISDKPVSCTEVEKDLLINRLETLIATNKIQNLKLFTENVIECSLDLKNNNRMEAVLQFNGEKCAVSVDDKLESNFNKYAMNSTATIGDSTLPNCLYRFGTEEGKVTFSS